MKIVIDIDESIYKKVKEHYLPYLPIHVCNECVYAVQTGTSFEDIKSRIKERADEEDIVNFAKGILFALEMIDSEVEE